MGRYDNDQKQAERCLRVLVQPAPRGRKRQVQ